jgi:hypothetical protein
VGINNVNTVQKKVMHLSNGLVNYDIFGQWLNFREKDKLYPCGYFSAAKELEVHVFFPAIVVKSPKANKRK